MVSFAAAVNCHYKSHKNGLINGCRKRAAKLFYAFVAVSGRHHSNIGPVLARALGTQCEGPCGTEGPVISRLSASKNTVVAGSLAGQLDGVGAGQRHRMQVSQ